VITGDLSCYCTSSLCYRHYQEKQCGFRIHPARLIFIKQREFTQNQLSQSKLISFVDRVTRPVSFSRIQTYEPGIIKQIYNWSNNSMQRLMISESGSTLREVSRHLQQVPVIYILMILDGFTDQADQICKV
jgi:hypothetical protein